MFCLNGRELIWILEPALIQSREAAGVATPGYAAIVKFLPVTMF